MAGEDPMRSPAARADMRLTYDDVVLFPDDGTQVARLVDFRHQSQLDQIEQALAALGRRLVVTSAA